MQAEELRDVFEEVNGSKECLQRCVSAMGGTFSKAQISRQLKAMSLRKNHLTSGQVCFLALLCLPNCCVLLYMTD